MAFGRAMLFEVGDYVNRNGHHRTLTTSSPTRKFWDTRTTAPIIGSIARYLASPAHAGDADEFSESRRAGECNQGVDVAAHRRALNMEKPIRG